MSETERSKKIDELSHEITTEILKRLEAEVKLGRLSLSDNYVCSGAGFICGNVYRCGGTLGDPSHSCSGTFGCTYLFIEEPTRSQLK